MRLHHTNRGAADNAKAAIATNAITCDGRVENGTRQGTFWLYPRVSQVHANHAACIPDTVAAAAAAVVEHRTHRSKQNYHDTISIFLQWFFYLSHLGDHLVRVFQRRYMFD